MENEALQKTVNDLQARLTEIEMKVRSSAPFEFETRQDNLPRFQRLDTTPIVETGTVTMEINGKAYQFNVLPL